MFVYLNIITFSFLDYLVQLYVTNFILGQIQATDDIHMYWFYFIRKIRIILTI